MVVTQYQLWGHMGHQGVGLQGLLSSPSLSQKPWNHDYDAGEDSAFLYLTFLVLKVGVMMLTPGVLVRIQRGTGRGLGNVANDSHPSGHQAHGFLDLLKNLGRRWGRVKGLILDREDEAMRVNDNPDSSQAQFQVTS